jgi:cobalamin-dependent methionine synthase I
MARITGWEPEKPPAAELQQIALQCVSAGADVLEINVQQHYDTPEAMQFAVRAVQAVADLPLCLSTNSPEVLQAGLKACRREPLVNYISIDQDRLKTMLPQVARGCAGVVLLVSDPAHPSDAEEMMEKAAILIGACQQDGITGERIYLDPGLIHVTSDPGQRHLVQVLEFLRALPDAVDAPVKTTCWLANGSAGAPRRLRTPIEMAMLPSLAGAGLSSVFLDVLRKDNMRTLRLLKIFNNEMVYADAEARL